MHIHVYMYICVCVCTCVCVRVYVLVRTLVFTCTCKHLHTYKPALIQANKHIYKHIYICTHVRTSIHTPPHTHAHTHKHTITHTNSHTQIVAINFSLFIGVVASTKSTRTPTYHRSMMLEKGEDVSRRQNPLPPHILVELHTNMFVYIHTHTPGFCRELQL